MSWNKATTLGIRVCKIVNVRYKCDQKEEERNKETEYAN